MRPTTRLITVALAGALTMAACGGGSEPSPTVAAPQAEAASTTVNTTPATTAITGATNSTAATTATTAAASTKANANTASQAEIQKALEAAGVSNAARWAGEVVEYRPYPTNDPTLAKLRQNLVKYNPGPGVVDGIVSALSL